MGDWSQAVGTRVLPFAALHTYSSLKMALQASQRELGFSTFSVMLTLGEAVGFLQVGCDGAQFG